MADKPIIPINNLPNAVMLSDSDVLLTVQGNTATNQASISLLGNHILNDMKCNKLETSQKEVTGAINELRGIYVTGEIPAHETAITLSDPRIKSSDTLEAIYTSVYGVPIKSAVLSGGSVRIKIVAQEEPIGIKVRITQ